MERIKQGYTDIKTKRNKKIEKEREAL